MTCPKCGGETGDGRFCRTCGLYLVQGHCPVCEVGLRSDQICCHAHSIYGGPGVIHEKGDFCPDTGADIVAANGRVLERKRREEVFNQLNSRFFMILLFGVWVCVLLVGITWSIGMPKGTPEDKSLAILAVLLAILFGWFPGLMVAGIAAALLRRKFDRRYPPDRPLPEDILTRTQRG